MKMKVFRINDKPVYKLYKCMNFDIFLSKKKFFFRSNSSVCEIVVKKCHVIYLFWLYNKITTITFTYFESYLAEKKKDINDKLRTTLY